VGKNALPPIQVTTTFYKNGVSAGSWTFDAAKASAPGAEAPVYGPYVKESTPVAVKVVIDATSVLAETREDNNTTSATLTCPK
jgi:subtilase family serine protease